MAAAPQMSLAEARALLGVAAQAAPEELRRAFRAAAKATHPDRAGGSAERFRAVVEAYGRLSAPGASDAETFRSRRPRPSSASAPSGDRLIIPLEVALRGGSVVRAMPDGRRVRMNAPAGLRTGDKVRAAGLLLTVEIDADEAWRAQGNDVWITAEVAPFALAEGGRLAIDTPLGQRIVWITRKAARRGLIRVRGEGLPARGPHPRGDLIVQLCVRETAPESAASAARRRFAEAWAA